MRSCVSASPGKNKISLIVETLSYWIVASPLIHHHHAPHFCQNISKVTSQRPIFSYFHFSLHPFVLANNNNTLFFLDYFLFHRHVRSEQRKGFEISTRCLPNPCLTSVTKMYGCVESVCDGFPCAGGTCARARAQIIVRCIVKLAGHGVPLFVGTS